MSSFGGVTQNSLMHNLHLTHAEEYNHLDIKHFDRHIMTRVNSLSWPEPTQIISVYSQQT